MIRKDGERNRFDGNHQDTPNYVQRRSKILQLA
jgi:hypothetical protein